MSDLNDATTDRLKLLRREYTAWRITFQDGERAAQAAYTRMRQLEAEVMFERDAAKMAEMRADAADAHITRLKFDIERYTERIGEMSKEMTNYLNKGDIKLRTRILKLEQELNDSKRFYADLLVHSGNEIRRLEGLLNAMCGPGTAETMRHENL